MSTHNSALSRINKDPASILKNADEILTIMKVNEEYILKLQESTSDAYNFVLPETTTSAVTDFSKYTQHFKNPIRYNNPTQFIKKADELLSTIKRNEKYVYLIQNRCSRPYKENPPENNTSNNLEKFTNDIKNSNLNNNNNTINIKNQEFLTSVRANEEYNRLQQITYESSRVLQTKTKPIYLTISPQNFWKSGLNNPTTSKNMNNPSTMGKGSEEYSHLSLDKSLKSYIPLQFNSSHANGTTKFTQQSPGGNFNGLEPLPSSNIFNKSLKKFEIWRKSMTKINPASSQIKESKKLCKVFIPPWKYERIVSNNENKDGKNTSLKREAQPLKIQKSVNASTSMTDILNGNEMLLIVDNNINVREQNVALKKIEEPVKKISMVNKSTSMTDILKENMIQMNANNNKNEDLKGLIVQKDETNSLNIVKLFNVSTSMTEFLRRTMTIKKQNKCNKRWKKYLTQNKNSTRKEIRLHDSFHEKLLMEKEKIKFNRPNILLAPQSSLPIVFGKANNMHSKIYSGLDIIPGNLLTSSKPLPRRSCARVHANTEVNTFLFSHNNVKNCQIPVSRSNELFQYRGKTFTHKVKLPGLCHPPRRYNYKNQSESSIGSIEQILKKTELKRYRPPCRHPKFVRTRRYHETSSAVFDSNNNVLDISDLNHNIFWEPQKLNNTTEKGTNTDFYYYFKEDICTFKGACQKYGKELVKSEVPWYKFVLDLDESIVPSPPSPTRITIKQAIESSEIVRHKMELEWMKKNTSTKLGSTHPLNPGEKLTSPSKNTPFYKNIFLFGKPKGKMLTTKTLERICLQREPDKTEIFTSDSTDFKNVQDVFCPSPLDITAAFLKVKTIKSFISFEKLKSTPASTMIMASDTNIKCESKETRTKIISESTG